MTKLGELLKAERENKGLSLHEIGMSLKINPKILKAIEDGNQNDLPAKTFLRGFVKSYAQYLRLDVKQALDMFQEEYGTTRPEEPQKVQPAEAAPQPIVSAPKFEKSLKRPDDAALPVSNNNRIYTILFAILLLTLIAFVAKMMDKYQKESRIANEVPVTVESTTTTTLKVPASVEAETLATPISETTSTTTAMAGATTTTTIGATHLPTTTSTTLKPAPTTSTTVTTTTMKAVTTTTIKAPVTTTTLKLPVTTTTLKAVVPVTTTSTTTTTTSTVAGATTTTLKAASTEVIVEALNKVKVRFSLNGGQKWDSIELSADQLHTFRSKTTVDLEISDGGAVNLIINGRDRGVPGTIGRPIKLSYPK
jgi:cytoskeleton protein RodZ